MPPIKVRPKKKEEKRRRKYYTKRTHKKETLRVNMKS
jgi:hypothetical protein